MILLDDETHHLEGDFADQGQTYLAKLFPEAQFTKFDYYNQGQLPEITADASGKLATEFDIIYLTGSKNDSYLDNDFNNGLIGFLKPIIDQQEPTVKLLGICFGHQIISRALGLEVVKNELGWEIGQYDAGDYTISMFHQDIVFPDQQKLAGFEIIGSTPKCEVQGLKSESVLTFQGHPEFSKEYTLEHAESLFAKGRFGKEVISEVRDRMSNDHDARLDNIVKSWAK